MNNLYDLVTYNRLTHLIFPEYFDFDFKASIALTPPS